MVRFVPYEKLPKKKQHELDRQKRGSWNGVNPVTRKPEDSKVYNRKKAQSWKKDNSGALLFCVYTQEQGKPGDLLFAVVNVLKGRKELIIFIE